MEASVAAADAVTRAQRALREIEHRRHTDDQRLAEETVFGQLSRGHQHYRVDHRHAERGNDAVA